MRFVLLLFVAIGCACAAHAEPAIPGSSGATGDAAARLLATQTVLQATGGADQSPLSAATLPTAPAARAAALPSPAAIRAGAAPQRFLPLHPPARAFPMPSQATGGASQSPLSAATLPTAPATAALPSPAVIRGGATPQRFLPLHPPARAFPIPPRGTIATTTLALRAMTTGSAGAQDLGRTALAAATAPSPAAAALAQLRDYNAPRQIKRVGGDESSFDASTRANAAIVAAMHQYRLTHGNWNLSAMR